MLTHASVKAGVALHWHGVKVPNAMDGVAGVTQDAVPVGGRFIYRFLPDRAGNFWYHSHHVSNEQVVGGRRRLGFARGRPGMWWCVNGHLFPNLPMYVVREGDVVRMRISNHSG